MRISVALLLFLPRVPLICCFLSFACVLPCQFGKSHGLIPASISATISMSCCLILVLAEARRVQESGSNGFGWRQCHPGACVCLRELVFVVLSSVVQFVAVIELSSIVGCEVMNNK